ncbi:hypothetical protein HDU78_010347 [Chytriomyces hyalinus]|nr:hypothetical protein HDU78_010347 [Chytriomyces hyalinus]
MKGLGKLFMSKVGNASQTRLDSDGGSLGNKSAAGSLSQLKQDSTSPASATTTSATTPSPQKHSLFHKVSIKKATSTHSVASAHSDNDASEPVPLSRSSRATSATSSKTSLTSPDKAEKSSAQQLKDVFKKLVTYDRIIKITPPSVEGPGPWSDECDTSPVPSRKLDLENSPDHVPVHVMTIGRPFLNPETNEEERRIKLYEHTICINNIKEVADKLSTAPEEALLHVDYILKYPQSKSKLTDKIMTKQAAIRSLSIAQISLLPLFGNWLNPILCPESEVKACSTNIFLCGHCPDHGTVARVLKPMEVGCEREAVKEHLMTMLATVMDTYWENHPNTGWAMCVTVPPGAKADKVFY